MNFIGEYQLEDTTVCDNLIEYFEKSDRQNPGWMGYRTFNTDLKDSMDVSVYPEEFEDEQHKPVLDYMIAMDKVLDNYVNDYPQCAEYGAWAVEEGPIIKRYNPGQGYHAWHCERSNSHDPAVKRHLVFMTYLNDIEDGGETEFLHQEVKIKPVKGKTLFWPADWTHTHRGVVSNTETKYIISGWFNYK